MSWRKAQEPVGVEESERGVSAMYGRFPPGSCPTPQTLFATQPSHLGPLGVGRADPDQDVSARGWAEIQSRAVDGNPV